ncbi:right-handed parallel beta-helix repeat-containing protein [Myxococcota bacterium]
MALYRTSILVAVAFGIGCWGTPDPHKNRCTRPADCVTGYTCTAAGTCVPDSCPGQECCGNGRISGDEECDDGGVTAGDGCSETCRTEPCWICEAEPSQCTCASECQDNDGNGTCELSCPGSGLDCGEHGSCVDSAGAARCECAPSYAGLTCSQCVVFVDDESESGDGSSWLTAFFDIQAGIDRAVQLQSQGHSCQVWVRAGVYYVWQQSNQDTIQLADDLPGLFGGFAGSERDLQEREPEQNPTVVDGGWPGGEERVLHVITGADSTLIDGLVIQHGLANGTGQDNHGGGILASQATALRIEGCTLRQNEAVYGGGLGAPLSGTVTRSSFSENYAQYGAAIHTTGEVIVEHSSFVNNDSSYGTITVANTTATVSLQNCSFVANHASRYGPGIYVSEATVEVAESEFFDNVALGDGGALRLQHAAIELTGSLFVRNTANRGGALYIRLSPTVQSHLSGNTYVDNEGGALFFSESNVTISGDTLVANHADLGAALCAESSTISLSETRIVGNLAKDRGGGVFLDACQAQASNVLWVGNQADNGGAVCSLSGASVLDLVHVTASDNRAAVGGCHEVVDSILTMANSISWNPDCIQELTEAGEGSSITITTSDVRGGWPGSGNLNLDPGFVTPVTSSWTAPPSYDLQSHTTTLYDSTRAWNEQDAHLWFVDPRALDIVPHRMLVVANDSTSITVLGNALGLASHADPYTLVDFHLGASPCIDAGTDQGLAADLDGNPRGRCGEEGPGCPDLGAFEQSD